MTVQEEKRWLRRRLRTLEDQLSSRYLASSGRAIIVHLLAMPEYQAAETVFCFVGVGREVDTRPLLEDALAAGKRLCVPLCTGPGHMELRQIVALEALTPGRYGIPEPPVHSAALSPDEVDFSILPCVTCDRSGRRLGRGGGYYDRFLTHYRGAAVLVCRERLIREEIPLAPHDCSVPWVVTERGLYEDGTPARLC